MLTQDTSKLHRASSGAALIPFEALIEEDESCLDELENINIGGIPFRPLFVECYQQKED